ncbi:DUF4190 domain-containing protein [Mycolicibacterium bacteremicum]|uniref:DUF4190 domain-containing protein n=1 Tax=Mycolicibacterium bacteremicum TaxID=564198 RepID=A0A1W9YTY9_MYCBA|nr:DUF4190 domain-containing protein [Mycolicibacterium bacteremicum]MCV7431104.1 DUF4190 domain-containing protein [Mycolicibacterium bacteremicum]ORA03447.1 hypothetical protein BST17_18680 [Mycolicibacterium bacteremicum]
MTDGRPFDYPDDAGLPPPVPPPYPGYPGYNGGYPPYPFPAPYKPPGTSGMAIGALVSALAGLVFCGLPSVAGLILGVIAMRQTRQTGQDGYGLALAATIIGGLVTAFMALGFLLWIGVFATGLTA